MSEVERKLAAAGVFAGLSGLEGLLNAQEFWDEQPYGTRLYYGPGNQYLHRSVLRAAVEILKRPATETVARCKARPFSDPPQDCDAPFCGCNPAWSEALEMLQECGWKSPQELRDAAQTAARPCTCHPDDNPPRPCPQKYALTDCRAAANGEVGKLGE